MKTIETTVIIAEDGTLTLQLPPDIPRGQRRIVLVVDDQPATEAQPP